ncbi:hypothetical protein HKX48_008595 [Thoreauomyces humboldtii]|nr:hypothetical protein HKX48_008595 [Thoreauomyces humboldtii]
MSSTLPSPSASGAAHVGRLGYACLNTVLRAQMPSVFSSRTCRLATIQALGPAHAHALALRNVKDLIPMLEWNHRHNIRFMRLSSEMLPLASHPEVGYNVKDVEGLVDVLKEVGDLARANGTRLTMHPGQFVQLASPREVVFEAALRDLEIHCDILDAIGLGKDSIMIIHMGGVYGDKPSTLERFHTRWALVPPRIQARIVLENDDMCYSVSDILPTCEALQIPLVLDWHHASIITDEHPPEFYLPRILKIWRDRGITPKQHVSDPQVGAVTPFERRKHAKRVAALPTGWTPDIDLMVEAKDKEQAVLHLYRVHGMFEVDEEYPVSAARQEELAKLGRRAEKKPKVEKLEVDEDGVALPKKLRKRRAAKVKKEEEEDDGEELADEADLALTPPTPAKKRAPRKKAIKSELQAEPLSEDVALSEAATTGKRKRAAAKKTKVKEEIAGPDQQAPSAKRKRAAVKVEQVDEGSLDTLTTDALSVLSTANKSRPRGRGRCPTGPLPVVLPPSPNLSQDEPFSEEQIKQSMMREILLEDMEITAADARAQRARRRSRPD